MPKPKAKDTPPPDQAITEIVGLVDAFCKQHLNAEYADLGRKLAEKLARKRPAAGEWEAEHLGVRDRSHDWLGQLP